MSTDLVLLIKCPSHPARPEQGCLRCFHAISYNRMTNAWGMHHAFSPEGVLIIWQVYEPRISWFGPDAFIRATIREGVEA